MQGILLIMSYPDHQFDGNCCRTATSGGSSSHKDISELNVSSTIQENVNQQIKPKKLNQSHISAPILSFGREHNHQRKSFLPSSCVRQTIVPTDCTNLIRVRNSTLGKSAPSLSNMVS